jgi:hypothetical protein
VISARQLYEDKFPNDNMQWKTQTFLDLQRKPFEQLLESKDK